ncbi:acyl-CoA dehydrogenase domain-containing protein, partial [mine drainage metagenome]
MDLSLSDEERDLQEAIRRFARKEIAPIADKMDREDYFPRDVFRRLGDAGFLGVSVPPEYGGLGLSYRCQALILEEIARVSPALALSVGAHSNLFCDNLARNGSDAQRSTFLPPLARGCNRGARSHRTRRRARTRSRCGPSPSARGDRYVLNGSKQFITNGPVADTLLVYAKTDPEKGSHGISAFIVPRSAPGFVVARSLDKMGMRGSPTGELAFQDCEIPAANLVGPENEGVRIMMGGLNVERAVLAGISVGITAECLERSLEYARQREQFGQKIGHFELIAAKIANMWMDLEASRQLLYGALAAVTRDKRSARASAAALTFASEASTRAALEAIQIWGGYGYMRDVPLERLARDAKLLEI